MSGQHADRVSDLGASARGMSRRVALRGLGVTMALPWLEAMTGAPGSVARAAAGAVGQPAGVAPLRMAFVFTPNGVNYPNWLPSGEGAGFALSPSLEPLAGVREHLNVLTGLTLDKARANGDGPGDHARSSASFLTGRQARKTAGNDIHIGISVDQFAAQQIGMRTRLPSLEIGTEGSRKAGNCDSGYSCAYTTNIAWRDEDTPVPKLIDPAEVFETLFGDVEQTSARREMLRRRASVLDFVAGDAQRLERKLGTADRRKLDEFQESVREIERRVQRAVSESDAEPMPDADKPGGIPRSVTEHLDLMYDMMLLAFRMDVTRIATFMNGNAGSNRTFPEIGITDGHHNLSHHRDDQAMVEKIQKIDRFYIERFARFVQRLSETPEGDGTLLDNCMVMLGSGIGDGNRHNHEDLPIVLAGRGGGTIATGRRINYARNTPICNLYTELLHRMDCDVESFGDSTGSLAGLV